MSYYVIVPDRIDCIRDSLIEGLKQCDCLILNGGTGLTSDDCTIKLLNHSMIRKLTVSGNFSG